MTYYTFHMSQLSIPGGVQSTVTSMSVCLSACISQKPNSNTTPNLLCMLTVAVVQSSYDSTAIYFIRTIIYKSQENYLITLTFRSHHETFIRRSWYSVPPDLYVTISCHIKKMVVGMTHLIAALILSLIHIWRCRRSYACRSRWSPYH